MNTFLQTLRRIARLLAALVLWLHAFFLLSIPLPPVASWGMRLHLENNESWMILLIAILSVLSSYGFKKLSVDLAYIYFFPFIVPYLIVRLGYRVFRGISYLLGRKDQTGRTAMAVAPAVLEAKPIATPEAVPMLTPRGRYCWKDFIRETIRPFRQFTLMWCLLLLLSSHKAIIWAALVIVLIHLIRLLVRVLVVSILSIKWLAQLGEKIRTYAEGLITKVLTIPPQGELTQDLRTNVASLIALRTGIELLRNRAFLVQSAVILGSLVFGVIYLYLAFVFGFAYYGLARVQSIPYTWGQAFVTSLFIPTAFGDLPQNVWIKLAGGVHWLFVVSLGIGTLFGYLQKKLDTLRSTAEYLSDRLKEQVIKERLDDLGARVNPGTVGTKAS